MIRASWPTGAKIRPDIRRFPENELGIGRPRSRFGRICPAQWLHSEWSQQPQYRRPVMAEQKDTPKPEAKSPSARDARAKDEKKKPKAPKDRPVAKITDWASI
jgi:hypothetical protein